MLVCAWDWHEPGTSPLAVLATDHSPEPKRSAPFILAGLFLWFVPLLPNAAPAFQPSSTSSFVRWGEASNSVTVEYELP